MKAEFLLLLAMWAMNVLESRAEGPLPCGLPLNHYVIYEAPPADVDVPFYDVGFYAEDTAIERVSTYHSFWRGSERLTSFIYKQNGRWEKTHRIFATVSLLGRSTESTLNQPIISPTDREFQVKVVSDRESLSQHVKISRDGGETWKVISMGELEQPAELKGEREALASVSGKGLRVFSSAGAWRRLTVLAVNFDAHRAGTLYLVTNKGLLKSSDNGKSWLLLPVGLSKLFSIHSFAINPRNSDELLVGTSREIYASSDGGCTFHVVLSSGKKGVS